jgi:hypothetical protein
MKDSQPTPVRTWQEQVANIQRNLAALFVISEYLGIKN